jgi:YbbR domain-containing protein
VKGKYSIWLKNVSKKEVKIDRDVFIFAFFLFLSFVFWYLNSLGKEIESETSYPVKYTNLPKDRILVEDLPSKLDLYLKGPGYSILKLNLSGNRSPILLDISTINYRRVPGSNSPKYYIKTSGLIKKLSNQLRADCEITSIKPDTLFFSFDRVVSKSVPVTPDIEIVTERQYFIKGQINIDPDSVIITGPHFILDTVRTAKTRYKRLTGLNKTVRKDILLDDKRGYDISEKRVTLTIPVEQFTEASIIVPIKLLNIPDSLDIKIFPDAVTVRCLVAVSDYKKIEEIPFLVVLDFKKVDLHSSDKIPIEVLNIPPFVNSLRFTPAKVDFLIEKKFR